jgi:hypothetical protein
MPAVVLQFARIAVLRRPVRLRRALLSGKVLPGLLQMLATLHAA